MTDFAPFLQPNFFLDTQHPSVRDYALAHAGQGTPTERVTRLYYAVRDGFRYSPWHVQDSREGFRASTVLLRADPGRHCIDKAVLLAACARVIGVPSRLHFANVRNHIGTEELERMLGTDLLVFHGYTELFLLGRWVAATPTFNKELCAHLGVAPLEFDGSADSIFQEFDHQGGRFMEYVHDYGSFALVPFDLMVAEWRRYYPVFMQTGAWPRPGVSASAP